MDQREKMGEIGFYEVQKPFLPRGFSPGLSFSGELDKGSLRNFFFSQPLPEIFRTWGRAYLRWMSAP